MFCHVRSCLSGTARSTKAADFDKDFHQGSLSFNLFFTSDTLPNSRRPRNNSMAEGLESVSGL